MVFGGLLLLFYRPVVNTLYLTLNLSNTVLTFSNTMPMPLVKEARTWSQPLT